MTTFLTIFLYDFQSAKLIQNFKQNHLGYLACLREAAPAKAGICILEFGI
jgi:hypothetical protein